MSHRHRHRSDGPCHFSLMSLGAGRRVLLALIPLAVLWLVAGWAGGVFG
ncbi:hypothetical protein [Salinicola halimionae]|nr:hypothetical protein [Salinicola halimionae]